MLEATSSRYIALTLSPSHSPSLHLCIVAFSAGGWSSDVVDRIMNSMSDLSTKVDTVQSDLSAKVDTVQAEVGAVKMKVDKIAYSATHSLSQKSTDALTRGALFRVLDKEGGRPLFCGFFTSPTVALTVNHAVMFQSTPLPERVYAISSAGRELIFTVRSTDSRLDFTVLKLAPRGGAGSDVPETVPAHFDLPSFSSVQMGHKLALVTMGIRLAEELSTSPTVTQYEVSVASVDDESISYSGGGQPFDGDSGAALLFDEGLVVGMHLETVDAKPQPRDGSSPRGAKRPRTLGGVLTAVDSLSKDLESVSEASSARGTMSRALLLSNPAVLGAVAAANNF